MAKRLNKEWKNLDAEPDYRFFAAEQINDLESNALSNIYIPSGSITAWVMWLMIDEDYQESAYEGGLYKLVLIFPDCYPVRPPLVTWTPPVYHPCVNQEAGVMGSDYLRQWWGPTKNVRWIMNTMHHMLQSEDFNHAVEHKISREIKEDYDIFKAKVQAQIQEQIQGQEYIEALRGFDQINFSPFPCDKRSLACLCQQYEDSGLPIGMLAFQRVLPQMYNRLGVRQNIIKFVFGFVKTERYHLKLSCRSM